MRFIDLDTWERKTHFEFFKGFEYPNYSVSANVDISKFYAFTKEHDLPFFASMVYLTTETINQIPNFKLRIRGEKVVEHDIIHPVFTVMTPSKLFNFCSSTYSKSFDTFLDKTLDAIEIAKNGSLNISNDTDNDNCIYITSLPWVSFTQVVHPIFPAPHGGIPTITFGKYFDSNGKLEMPLSLQVHHGLIDGLHIGLFFEKFQEILDNFNLYVDRSFEKIA